MGWYYIACQRILRIFVETELVLSTVFPHHLSFLFKMLIFLMSIHPPSMAVCLFHFATLTPPKQGCWSSQTLCSQRCRKKEIGFTHKGSFIKKINEPPGKRAPVGFSCAFFLALSSVMICIYIEDPRLSSEYMWDEATRREDVCVMLRKEERKQIWRRLEDREKQKVRNKYGGKWKKQGTCAEGKKRQLENAENGTWCWFL